MVVLFVMVLITFSFAQEDSKKKMTKMYSGVVSEPAPRFLGQVQNLATDNDNTTDSRQ